MKTILISAISLALSTQSVAQEDYPFEGFAVELIKQGNSTRDSKLMETGSLRCIASIKASQLHNIPQPSEDLSSISNSVFGLATIPLMLNAKASGTQRDLHDRTKVAQGIQEVILRASDEIHKYSSYLSSLQGTDELINYHFKVELSQCIEQGEILRARWINAGLPH